MTESQWNCVVDLLIRQGVVQTEAEAVERLLNRERLPVQAKVAPTEWRGLMGTG